MRHLRFDDVSKHPTETRLLRLDFFPLVATFWRPGEQYATNGYVRPRAETGFAYQASAAGQSGLTEPAWPTTLSGTVVDGSITWTAVASASNGVQALTSPTVVVDPTGGITLGSPSMVDGKGTDSAIQFTVLAGTVGEKYRIECQVTAGSETLRGSIEVEVRLK